MEFIFGSNRENGYGLLYTDAKHAEANNVRTKITLPITEDIDCYGFLTFGTNNNQPLFFKIKKDTSYPRGAYYIHGVFRQAIPTYFATDAYEKDMFIQFIDQMQLDELREEGKSLIREDAPSVSLAKCKISDSMLRDLLMRIYKGEKLLLAIDDSVYSLEYGKLLIAKLFRYLLPSLRKTCSFVIGTTEVGGQDVRIRIVPRSMVAGNKEQVIYVNATEFTEVSTSEITMIVDAVLSYDTKKRQKFFDIYELLFQGYSSYYHPKKLSDFWKVLSGDVEAIEKITDSYLASCEDPEINAVPKFITSALSERFASIPGFYSMLKVPTLHNLLRPEFVLEENDILFRKIFVFNAASCEGFLFEIFHEVMKKATIDDKWIEYSKPIMLQFVSRDFSNLPKYQACFMSAVAQVYHKMLERIECCIPIKEKGLYTINAFFARCRSIYPNTVSDTSILDRELLKCQNDAKLLNYDLMSSLSQEKLRQQHAYQRYVEEHKEQDTQNQVQSLLLTMQRGITQKTNSSYLEDTARQLLNCGERFDDAVNDVFVEYILERFKSGKEDKVIHILARQSTRFYAVVRGVAQREVMLPILLIAKYGSMDTAIKKVRAYIYKYRAEINLFNKTKRKAFIQRLKEILVDRCGEEKHSKSKTEKQRYEVTGFSKDLIRAIDAVDNKGGTTKVYVIAVCTVVLLLIGILAATFLLGSGGNDKDAVYESTGMEDSGSTSESQPSGPNGTQPSDPDGTQPSDPDGTQSSDPDGTQPSDPDGTQPSDPDGTQPSDPDGTQPSDPDGTQPSDPDGTQPSDPDETQTGGSEEIQSSMLDTDVA